MFLGGLQAFIFALLTVLYFGMAGAHDGHEEREGDAHETHDEHDTAEREHATAQPEPAH